MELENPRILFYAVNGLGLGHVTRCLAIARALRKEKPHAQILFLTTSEADSVIYNEGFAAIKLPSKTAATGSRLRPQAYAKLMQTVAWNAISAFSPAVLVVDTFPAGTLNELLPVLRWEMRRVFVYRAQQGERARNPLFQSTLALYDLALIPHAEGSEDAPLTDALTAVWTGDIVIRSREEALSRGDARERLGLPAEGKLVYVTFGGGGEQELENALGATLAAAEGTDWHPVVARAPLDRSPRKSAKGVCSVSYYPMAECLAAFDGAVSAAGYNSAVELLHHGVPSILIPFPRGLDDQFARVQKAVAAGSALTSPLDAAALREQLISLSDPVRAGQLRDKSMAATPADGAAKAAETILGLL